MLATNFSPPNDRIKIMGRRYLSLMFLKTLFSQEKTVFKSFVEKQNILKYSSVSKMLGEKPTVENSIKKKLESEFEPTHLSVINESYMHNVPRGSETHFKIICVSKMFENMALLKRHRAIHAALSQELENGVHALSINAKSPSEWTANMEVEPTPKCLGGFGK